MLASYDIHSAGLTKQIKLVFKSEKSENLSPSYLEAYMWHDNLILIYPSHNLHLN